MKHWAKAERPFVGAYGFAHFGKALFWQSAEILFIFYLTELCGLPPRTTGAVVGGALLFSAVLDLAVGRFLPHRLQTTAQAARLQLAGTILCAAGLLLFAWAPAIPSEARVAYVFGASLIFRCAYALVDVPQNAMLCLATRTPAQRTDLSSLRYVVGGLAAVVVAGMVGLAVKGLQASPSLTSVSLVLGGLGAIAVTGALLQAGAARNPGRALDPGPSRPGGFAAHPVATPIPALILMSMLLSATAPVFAKLEPYFAAYGLGSAAAGGFIVGATSVGGVVAQPLWFWISGRCGRRASIRAGAALLLLGSGMFYVLAPCGMIWACLCGLMFGAGLGGVGMALWAALADAAAQPNGHDERRVVPAFARLAFASKSALALSCVFVAELIARADYRGLSIDGDWPLLAVMCLAPAGGAAACWLAAGAIDSPQRHIALLVAPRRAPAAAEAA